jgi:hypothetical protein
MRKTWASNKFCAIGSHWELPSGGAWNECSAASKAVRAHMHWSSFEIVADISFGINCQFSPAWCRMPADTTSLYVSSPVNKAPVINRGFHKSATVSHCTNSTQDTGQRWAWKQAGYLSTFISVIFGHESTGEAARRGDGDLRALDAKILREHPEEGHDCDNG